MSRTQARFIPVYQPFLGKEEAENVRKAVESGWVSSKGDYITQFERDFSTYIGHKQGISTSNGTTSLHLALKAAGIGPGDEVIVPDLTFVAPINAIFYVGAKPVLVDANEETWAADADAVRAAFSSRTRAVIIVHLYGNPAPVDTISEYCARRGVMLIEDAAEAHGAEVRGRRVGSFGDVSCFSFYGNKVITTGEGGMCLTSDADLAQTMRVLRDHGMSPDRRYWHDVVGFNYRMTNVQAAIGVAQLKKIDDIILRKTKIADLYAEALDAIVAVQKSPAWGRSVFWLFSILVNNVTQRESLIRNLASHNVDSRPFFHPAHQMPPYAGLCPGQNFPVSDSLSSRGLNLPSYPSLTEEEVLGIADLVRSFLSNNRSN